MEATVAVFSTNVSHRDLSPTASGTQTVDPQPVWPSAPAVVGNTSQATDVTLLKERTGWLVKALQSLSRMLTLENDWDSYGAEPPNKAAIGCARSILDLLAQDDFQPTSLDASSEGGVCLSFQHAGRYGDIECFNSGEVLAVVSSGSDDTSVWDLANLEVDIQPAMDRIRSFLKEAPHADA